MTTPRRLISPMILGLVALGSTSADARPGGGSSYSGSSHSSGGGGSSYSGGSRSSGTSYASHSSSGSSHSGDSSDSAALMLIFGLGLIVVPTQLYLNARARRNTHDSGPRPPSRRPRRLHRKLRDHDPEFSAVLFEDLVFALYARVHAARRDPAAMAALAPYATDSVRTAMLRRNPQGVAIHGVVIGSMTIDDVRIDEQVEVDLTFEANFTADLDDGPQGHYVRERWTLARALDVRSRPPDSVLTFQCPACGAPYERSDADACSHCGEQVEGGRFDWSISGARQLELETRPPALTGAVEEQGTGLPTVTDPALETHWTALQDSDPEATEANLHRRLRAIYAALNTAWTDRDLRKIRPHVSDSLFNYLTYWIDAYRSQNLKNVLKDMSVSRIQVVKVVRDKYFDAVTLRFHASGFDFNVDEHGETVSGSTSWKRSYSEYWTLIRGAGVRGGPRDMACCPGCGGPLERINMAGACEHCGNHLTRGEFDWVLSKIEQDEAYQG